MRNKIFYLIIFLFIQEVQAQQKEKSKLFEIYSPEAKAAILYHKNVSSLDSLSAHLLAEDINRVSGEKPFVTGNRNEIKGNVIVIGEVGSDLINSFIKTKEFPENFAERKESYLHKIVSSPSSTSSKAYIIAGTDPRGTTFGVFELSEKVGVSPWYFWADVPVNKQEEIIIEQADYFSEEPSVEYRGIFLNDEDWGLQPWAEHTFEPEVGDIGSKTYSKIFELLLRLKANTIWPAMHPSTKAFFHYPGNPEMASKYHIVVGSSHAEPMLRNNVDEWNKDSMGDFSYVTNEENVHKYWEERVKEATGLDAIYTLGMRGVHDSGMEGVGSTEEAASVLSRIIQDQRNLLKKHNEQDLAEIPQAFTVYKEVLDLYDHGLEVPEDVTIMWTDDNYGYIRRLSNEQERAREGGGGVYYHASYWGRPHDYQWLSSTHPGLIREEMVKAYETNSKKMWILNVGDLKPAEYNMQFFMDMAYDIEKFKEAEYIEDHMVSFYSDVFGEQMGRDIAEIKSDYFKLAYERKPEFMGWSQTEPTTQIDTTAYAAFSWGDEVNTRINKYEELEKRAEQVMIKLPNTSQDAYFQLVYYPLKGASFMNKKFLYRDLAIKYSKQHRLSAKDYRELSHQYYDSIVALTQEYNTEVAEGKWKEMIDMAPRGLPVFEKPKIPLDLDQNPSAAAGISVENASGESDLRLPTFYENSPQTHFFDIYLKKPGVVKWSVRKVSNWLNLSQTEGNLTEDGMSEKRITVGIDWQKWRKAKKPREADFTLRLGKRNFNIELQLESYDLSDTPEKIFTEQNGIVAIYAENYSGKSERGGFKWQKIPGLGYSDNLMQALPFTEEPLDTLQLKESSPYLEYTIYTESLTNDAELILNALPTHPLTNDHGVRVGVQWNDGPVQVVDFRTYGRSREWKENVLRNLAQESVPVEVSRVGDESLKIYMIDEGVALDFIYLNLKDVELPYSLLPETRLKK